MSERGKSILDLNGEQVYKWNREGLKGVVEEEEM